MNFSDGEALPDYAELAQVLSRCGATHSPAEAHGFALGLAIANVSEPLALWQQELYSDFDPADVLAGECRSALDKLFANVLHQQSAVEQMQLTLLLPSGIVVDTPRLGAVSEWCEGFLFGFGLGGDALMQGLSDQSKDLLRDITEITRLDTGDVENNEENQSALIEIEEYLRVGVMLVRDEVRELREADEPN